MNEATHCRVDGDLKICATHASLTAGVPGRRLPVTADIRLTVSNLGPAPLSLFSVQSPAMALPDSGAGIAGTPEVYGLPQCIHGPVKCAADRRFTPLTLGSKASATISVRVGALHDVEEGARYARATRISLSWAVAMIDAEQRPSAVSLSVDSAKLDNGIAGPR